MKDSTIMNLVKQAVFQYNTAVRIMNRKTTHENECHAQRCYAYLNGLVDMYNNLHVDRHIEITYKSVDFLVEIVDCQLVVLK